MDPALRSLRSRRVPTLCVRRQAWPGFYRKFRAALFGLVLDAGCVSGVNAQEAASRGLDGSPHDSLNGVVLEDIELSLADTVFDVGDVREVTSTRVTINGEPWVFPSGRTP